MQKIMCAVMYAASRLILSLLPMYPSTAALKWPDIYSAMMFKGKDRGVAVGGCRYSVVERWHLKPEAQNSTSIAACTTFHSCFLFQRLMDSYSPHCVFNVNCFLWFSDSKASVYWTPAILYIIPI